MAGVDDGIHPYPVNPGPTPESKARRRAAAKIAANERWANEPDRRAATQAARDAMERKFEDQVDPGRLLDPAERARRVVNAKSAHYTRIAMKSADTRRRKAS